MDEIIQKLLELYEDAEIADRMAAELTMAMDGMAFEGNMEKGEIDETECILITYGDTLTEDGKAPLNVLHEFLTKYVGDTISTVHFLPFYPYSSDDGFSVIDYTAINPRLGTWEDIGRMERDYHLMFDLVANHVSKYSRWFQGYAKGEKEFDNFFIACDPDADYSMITRPRAAPLLNAYSVAGKNVFLWTTFSEDQIDLNYANPKVLLAMLKILVMYARRGAKYIRLDAIGYLWKELGTPCIHHEKTHKVIQLMKLVLNKYAPGTRLITETNVPHKENISYFSKGGDEADLVYQFALPPLVLFSFAEGSAQKLNQWVGSLKMPPGKTTFLNFLSSHDGIGIRPVEDILSTQERDLLIRQTLCAGGQVSYKDNGDGTKSPYELNINYQDALSSPEEPDETRIKKFIAAETILLSLQGVPGIYIQSLLGSRNNYLGEKESGIYRRINRENLDYAKVQKSLESEDSNRGRIFYELKRRISLRKKWKAFSPFAKQKVLFLQEALFSIVRESDTEKIYVLVNVSDRSITLEDHGIRGYDILHHKEAEAVIFIAPYETAWIVNKKEDVL